MFGQTDRKTARVGQVRSAFDVRGSSAFLTHGHLSAEMDGIEAHGAVGGPHDQLRRQTMRNPVVHPLSCQLNGCFIAVRGARRFLCEINEKTKMNGGIVSHVTKSCDLCLFF